MEGLLQYLPLFNDQNPVAYDEDCLYLSVYTSNPTSAAKLPVSKCILIVETYTGDSIVKPNLSARNDFAD